MHKLTTLAELLVKAQRKGWNKTANVYLSPIRRTTEKVWRPACWPGQDGNEKFATYLERISDAVWTTSPGGDRLDTYRHWEIIAFDSIPVTNLPSRDYEQLFCGDMLFVHSKSELDSLL